MQLWLTQQPIHHRLLYTIPENAVEWVCDNRQATLLVDQFNAALDAQARRDALLEEESEHVPLARADLLAHDQLEAIVAFRHQVARAQSAGDGVVVGNRD